MSCRKIAVYPGSFDPLTNGHQDIINRGAVVFDELVVAVAINQEKRHLFSINERIEMIREIFAGNSRVTVETFDGLLIHYAQRRGAHAIVRGLRAVSDFEYEFQMALMNRKLAPTVETFFMMSSESYMYVSSRIVKEMASLGGRVTDLVHPLVEQQLKEKYAEYQNT
ncbi:MAG: pantetheine-phosphate adenylyltransferase [Deltaproteobacteria bacterium]|nr:pantetheine-phosphate adenylyltransferase [Candidatus Anaeroferrophillacea bacterium]